MADWMPAPLWAAPARPVAAVEHSTAAGDIRCFLGKYYPTVTLLMRWPPATPRGGCAGSCSFVPWGADGASLDVIRRHRQRRPPGAPDLIGQVLDHHHAPKWPSRRPPALTILVVMLAHQPPMLLNEPADGGQDSQRDPEDPPQLEPGRFSPHRLRPVEVTMWSGLHRRAVVKRPRPGPQPTKAGSRLAHGRGMSQAPSPSSPPATGPEG